MSSAGGLHALIGGSNLRQVTPAHQDGGTYGKQN
jgi:hypothetical protein